MKRLISFALLITFAAMPLAGCGRRINYDLPASPTAFSYSSFTNPVDKDDSYMTIEYNGRTYVPYGTLKKSCDGDDIGECLGYIVQDGVELKDTRVFLLRDDTDSNYLAEIDVKGEMSQPIFLRASDTAGKNINTPDIIDSLGYEYWK